MKLYECPLWISDIDEVSIGLPELSMLSGKSVLVTGATGLICSAVVDILLRYNETHEIPIQIYIAGRDEKKVVERFGENNKLIFVYYDASLGNNEFNFRVDYIIHGASNAYPSVIIDEPVETMVGNFNGIKELLDYAICAKTKRVLYISSAEVYGNKLNDEPFKEDEYGYIDILNVRNSYSVGKCAAETLCVAYADEYGVDSVIVRPSHTFGPTASSKDNRVASAWAFSAARGDDIIMKSDGSQIRSIVIVWTVRLQ